MPPRVQINWKALTEHMGLPTWITSRQELRAWTDLTRGPKMNKITDNIYLGSSQDAQHRKPQLKAAGITAILNVARDLTNATTTHKEFEMYHIGIMDSGGNRVTMAYAALIVFHTLLDAGHTVLVHCHEGKSRSAGLVAAYLFGHQSYPEYDSFEKAEAFLKTCRPRVDVNKDVKTLFVGAMGL